MNHPLPSRPTALTNAQATTSRATGLSLPRSPYPAAPPAASPLPPLSSQFSLNTPAPKPHDRPSDPSTLPWRQIIDPATLQLVLSLVPLNEGWQIYYRRWEASPTLVSDSPTLTTHPSTANSLPSTSKSTPIVTSKRSREAAFDDAQSSSPAPVPTTSTPTTHGSTSSLQSRLQGKSIDSDSIEMANRTVYETARSLGGSMSLFSHVGFVSPIVVDVKGKGKQKESDQEIGKRELWVFAVIEGAGENEMEMDDAVTESEARKKLDALQFSNLIELDPGSFTHRQMFPALYSESTFVSPESLPITSFPSALALSSETSSSSEMSAVYQAFLAAAKQEVAREIISQSTLDQSPISRLADSLLFLPILSTPTFGFAGSRIVSEAIQVSFRFSLQRNGILLQPIVEEVPLKMFPIQSTVAATSPVILAPYGTPAVFVRNHVEENRSRTEKEVELKLRMRDQWSTALLGTGLSLAEEESWIVCRIGKSNEEDGVDVIWPRSLCLLDGTRPQPERTPESTPQQSDPPELPSSPTSSLSLDTYSRRRLHTLVRRPFHPSPTSYRDPITLTAERVGAMIVDVAKDRARRAKEAADAAILAAAQAPPPPPPPTAAPIFDSRAVPAAGPINMRTPISLGGSATDGTSPAAHFPEHRPNAEKGLEHKLADVAESYPSPAHIASIPVRAAAPVVQPAQFDWGDDFGGSSNFDDGMMMGLTDDDFSFFDDPRPAPPAMSTATSPKFVEHFSHLTGTTPFASALSPTSPFANSPQLPNVSPSLGTSYAFDAHPLAGNALGLGVTPINDPASPFKTPRTPYTPYVDPVESPIPQSRSFSVGLVDPSIRSTRTNPFEAIQFGSAHQTSDEKYDSIRGKFGLPTPEADSTDDAAKLAVELRKVDSKSTATWYTTICDPRVGAAGKLKRRKSELEKQEVGNGGKSSLLSRRWRSSFGEGTRETLDESDDDYSDDESRETMSRDRQIQLEDDARPLPLPFGPSLLLLRAHVDSMLFPPRMASTEIVASPMKRNSDVARETSVAVFADQLVHNRSFRSWTEESPEDQSSCRTVPAYALQTVATRLASLSVSPAGDKPRLIPQPTPLLQLRHQQFILELSSAAVDYWRPMGFEPFGGQKDVVAFIIYEEGGPELTAAIKKWSGKVADTYQGSRLGSHTLGSTGNYPDGLASCAVGRLSTPSGTFLKSICTNVEVASRSHRKIIVYILDPANRPSFSPTSSLALLARQLSRLDLAGLNSTLVFALPLSSVINTPEIQSQNALLRLAFSVYDRLAIPIGKFQSRPADPFPRLPTLTARPFKLFQSPAFVISPSRPTPIKFDLQWPTPSLEILHRHRFLHVGYSIVPCVGEESAEWVVMSCIDERGESWRTLSQLVRNRLGSQGEDLRLVEVWNFARRFAEEANVEWRIVIGRMGEFERSELEAWDSLLVDELATWSRPAHVTILNVDLSPPSSVVPAALDKVMDDTEELAIVKATPTTLPAHSTTYSYIPNHLIAIGRNSDLVSPCTHYLINIPRTASLSHSLAYTPHNHSDSQSISVTGLYFLISHSTPTSTLSMGAAQHTQEIRQSFVELAELGRVRDGTVGRIPIHFDWLLSLERLVRLS